MIYKDEDVRNEFHCLPTELQLKLAEFEEFLAEDGQYIYVDGVENEDHLEIVIRIADQFHLNSIN